MCDIEKSTLYKFDEIIYFPFAEKTERVNFISLYSCVVLTSKDD